MTDSSDLPLIEVEYLDDLLIDLPRKGALDWDDCFADPYLYHPSDEVSDLLNAVFGPESPAVPFSVAG